MQRVGITVTGPAGSGSTTQGRILAKEFDWPFYYSGNAVRWLMQEAENEGSWEPVIKRKETALVEGIIRVMEAGNVIFEFNAANQYGSFPPELDRIVDLAQMYLLGRKDFGVHEGRVAWHFAKTIHANGAALDKRFIHILYEVDRYTGAARQLDRPANTGKNLRQVLKDTEIRIRDEQKRYRELYGIELYVSDGQINPEPFDIKIDTTDYSEGMIARITLEELRHFCPDLFS